MAMEDPLAALGGEVPPPAELKARVTDDLRARGLLTGTPGGASRWGRVRITLAAAAAVAIFVAGIAVGRRDASETSPAGPRFALLLYEPAGFDTTRTHEELAAEYGAWAASLESRFESGDALGAQRVIGGSVAAAGEAVPTGYFILRAADWDAAMAIATGCPHLRHGGVVAVREVIG